MKRILLFLFLLPLICYSQEQVSTQIYGFNMPIELDSDTTYSYLLDNTKCTNSLYGVDEKGGCNYLDSYPFLYFYHQFSLNCCTEHFYQIEVKGDSIFINQSDSGEYCLCGSCTYELTFSDQNPTKNEYHISISGRDTTVSKFSTINETDILDEIDFYYSSNEEKIYIKNGKQQKITVFLWDINGRMLQKSVLSEKLGYLNVDNIKSGIYFIKIIEGHNFKIEKIIITK